MAKATRSLDGNNPVLSIDLASAFGVDSVDDSVAQAVGGEILELIKNRTQEKNEDKRHKDFKDYSTDYVDSLAFKVYGKSESDVNLTASGDMLNLMDIIDFDGQILKIGWDDDKQAAKAHGHITGKDGQVPRMKRDFFGISTEELNKIIEPMKKEVRSPDLEKQKERDVLTEILKSFQASFSIKDLFRKSEPKK